MSTPSHEDKVKLQPNIMSYPHHVGAPVITPTDLTPFIRTASHKVNKALQKRAAEIVQEMNALQEDWALNQEVYSAKFSFEPIVGECYHLYEHPDGTRFLSLIAPSQWRHKHLYSVILNSDLTWSKTSQDI